jgi:hypothetical protein
MPEMDFAAEDEAYDIRLVFPAEGLAIIQTTRLVEEP